MSRVVFKVRFLWFVAFALVAGVWPMAAQASVVPDPAAGFPVLAGTASTGLTCTDSNVTGQAGILTGAAVASTRCNMQVTNADDAYHAFVDAYNQGLGPCGPTTLDSTASGVTTLATGTYCTPAGLTLTGRTLTLTGPGPWIFEIGAGLTATSLTVVSGDPCNVFWWVGADATATTSALQGTILANAITFTDTVLAGRAWSTGAVTMTRTNIFGCNGATPPSPANCTAAKQALATAKAQDIVEDAAERAAAKTNPDKTADRAEDKAEQAIMKALNGAARAACARVVTPQCLAARDALAANVAQDRVEDRAEKAADNDKKDSAKDNKKDSDRDNKKDSDKDKSEDKAEQATTRALQHAVSDACGPGRHDDNDDNDDNDH